MFNYAWTHANTPVQRTTPGSSPTRSSSDLQNLASGGGEAPHGKYVHLYLNGLYWGLYNVHERPDDSFAAEILRRRQGRLLRRQARQQRHRSRVHVGRRRRCRRSRRIKRCSMRRGGRDDPTSAANYQAVQSDARRRSVHRLHDRPLLRRRRGRLVAQQLVRHVQPRRCGGQVAIPRVGPGARFPDDRQRRMPGHRDDRPHR